MSTLIDLLKKSVTFLQSKHIENAKYDAERLFAYYFKCPRLHLFLNHEQKVSDQQKKDLRSLILRRAAHEPLQYITEEVEFFNVFLDVDSRVLIPRSETEELVERLSKVFESSLPLSILDLGTGSGAIAISLAKFFKNSEVLAVDRSTEALKLAQKNAEKNGVNNVLFLESNWYDCIPVEKRFDLIVANPPYLTQDEWESAQTEVRNHEPYGALVAEKDGLSDIEIIINGSKKYLKSGGILAIETGIDHGQALKKRYEGSFSKIEIVKDFCKRDRFFMAQKSVS